jgi:hypothetical protein
LKLDLPSAEECKKIDQQIEATMRLSLEDRKGLGLVDDSINKEMNSTQVGLAITKIYKKQEAENRRWLKRVGQHTTERQRAYSKRAMERLRRERGY